MAPRHEGTLVTKAAGETDLRALAGEIVRDCEWLFVQQLDLLRAEVGRELGKAGRAACLAAAGGGLAASGGLLSGLALAHLLRRITGLHLWVCYAAGACGLTGAGLLRAGGRELADVHLLPLPQTAAALKENVTWLKEQLNPATP
jgi:hypothetical protein